MKKIILTIILSLLFVRCDDNNKRDTPLQINFTIWQSTSITPPSTEETTYLKFYDTTFDLIYERTVDSLLVETTLTSGTFIYRRPKLVLDSPSSSIQGIVTGNAMLLDNRLVFERKDIDAF